MSITPLTNTDGLTEPNPKHHPRSSAVTEYTTRAVPLRGEPADDIDRRVREALDEALAEDRRRDADSGQVIVALDPPEPRPAPCTADDGRSFWPVFVTADGEPTPAWVVAEKLADHTGRITDEVIGDSFEIVGDLRNVTRGGFGKDEFDAAWNALKAERRLRNAETRDRYEARFPEGPWSDDLDMSHRRPKPIPHMLTAAEVGEIFRVSPATVARESRPGGSLPQPIRVGSQLRWPATSIHAKIERATR